MASDKSKKRQRIRFTAIAAISLECMVCGTYENLQLDHHIPCRNKNERIPAKFNRAVLCRYCNAAKQDMHPTEFIHYLDRLGAKVAKARYIAHLTHRHKGL